MRPPVINKANLFSSILLSLLLLSSSQAQDLKAEDIIAKHLESIGTKEKRDEVKTRIAAGASSFESKQPDKKAVGKAVLVSDANNLFFLSSFNSTEYPFEKVGLFS